jgi:putative protein-disulfide isomerase
VVTAHYFFDPMCGWCYGATQLAEVLNAAPHVNLVLHPGGMIKRRKMDNDFRQRVKGYDQKIALLTGQLFSDVYYNKLASNETIVLDSYITALAVNVMGNLNNKSVEMLKAIQQAYYQYALDVSDQHILADIAGQFGIERNEWLSLMLLEEQQINNQIKQNQKLMEQWSVKGFPTFIIEKEDNLTLLAHENFYNDPIKWKIFIENM